MPTNILLTAITSLIFQVKNKCEQTFYKSLNSFSTHYLVHYIIILPACWDVQNSNTKMDSLGNFPEVSA